MSDLNKWDDILQQLFWMVSGGYRETKRYDLRTDIIVKGLLRHVRKGIWEEFQKSVNRLLKREGIQSTASFSDTADAIQKLGKNWVQDFYLATSHEMYNNIFKHFKPVYPN